ncbi:MAG: PorP/SprF family type IX secretion system membrane protein [Bacteroidetes bacterium]|nr:PorP/SprF family type IX secretion system membrane protein [Bacteroidota bacterium]
MKNKLIILFFCGLSMLVKAQQLPQFTQFAQNQALLNPAFIGTNEDKEINLGGRWQMLGFGNEPHTAFGLYSQQLKTKEKEIINPSLPISREIPEIVKEDKRSLTQAFGANVGIDKYGAFGTFELNGLYAIHYKLTKKLKLSGGAKLGFSNNSFDPSKAIVANLNDPTLSYQGGDLEYDEFISSRTNNVRLNLGLGGAVHYEGFYVAGAISNLTGDLIEIGSSQVNFQTTPHLFFSTGYNHSIGQTLSVNTTLLLKKMSPAPISTELSIVANFDENLFGGLIYRHKSAIGVTGGFNINEKFRLGYSVDFSINKLRYASNGGHELILRYRF